MYYYQKYRLLKENGYFSQSTQQEKHHTGLDADAVKKSLANCTQVTFEVTDNCNLECEYCGYGKFYCDYDKRENKHLDADAARNLLDYLTASWNSSLNQSHDRNIYVGFYGGEPLLNMPFVKAIVRHVGQVKMEHNRFSYSMTTNGLLLEKHMDFLYQNDFNLLISLDGSEENNGYRVFKNGKPAYHKILANVKALQNKYPDYFRRKVNFNAVLHNKNSVADIYNYFKKEFDKIPSIGELNTSGIKDSQKKKFWKTYSNVTESLHQNEDYSMMEKDMFVGLPNVQEVMTYIHNYNDFCFSDYNDLIYSNKGRPRMPTGTCIPFSKKIFLTVNGKILPCERIGQQYGMGTATPEAVELDYEAIADKFNGCLDKMATQCGLCCNSDTCVQCLFNLDIDNEKPVCNGFMTQKDRAGYLSSLVDYIEENKESYWKILEEVGIE
ncbi:MAG: radical SAM peptide maturase [bacterium]|nr:radical SAM peptide maturase [bacterium]